MKRVKDLHHELRTVLCVQNDAESRVLLGEALAEHQLVFVANAFEALNQINIRGFHAYVLEYWLPDLSGTALCREIRKVDPDAPIVFCTAAARPEDRVRAMSAGANDYFTKPVLPSELKSKLRASLSLA